MEKNNMDLEAVEANLRAENERAREQMEMERRAIEE